MQTDKSMNGQKYERKCVLRSHYVRPNYVRYDQDILNPLINNRQLHIYVHIYVKYLYSI